MNKSESALLVAQSCHSDSFQPPRTVAHQAPPSMGFCRQEYWSGLPCPSLGDLPNSGIESRYPASQVDSSLVRPSSHIISPGAAQSLTADSWEDPSEPQRRRKHQHVCGGIPKPSCYTSLPKDTFTLKFVTFLSKMYGVAPLVNNPPAKRENWVQSLGWEDPLEKGKATHSSILAWWIYIVHLY